MMTINGAGGAQNNPILKGLGIVLAFAGTDMDIAQVNDAYIDQAAGFPGANTVKANLSPAATVITAGASGGYNDTTKQWTIGDTTGLAAGDLIYLSHGLITDGLYFIDSVVDATHVTIQDNPLNSSGNQSNVAYQVGWSWRNSTSASPVASSGAGTQNWFKADAEDAVTIGTQVEDSLWIADSPAAADFVELEAGDFSGRTVTDNQLSLTILRGWANNGGVAYAELANHSSQARNDFTWQSGGGVGEKSLADAEAGLVASVGDGAKYGRLELKSATGSVYTVGVDIDITIDTSGPSVQLYAFAA